MEQFIVPQVPGRKEQPIKLDPLARQQAILEAGNPPIEQTPQQSLVTRFVEKLTAPIRAWNYAMGGLREMGTGWAQQLMDEDARIDPNSIWGRISAARERGRAMGGEWGAWQAMWKEANLSRDERPDFLWGERFATDILLDPANLVGWGLFGAGAKGTVKLGALGSRMGGVGRFLGEKEAAYIRGVDSVFKGLGNAVRKGAGSSDTAIANYEGARAIDVFKKFVGAEAYAADRPGTVGLRIGELASKRASGVDLSTEEAGFVGLLDSVFTIREPVYKAVAKGGTLDGLFKTLAEGTPTKAAKVLGDRVSKKGLAGLAKGHRETLARIKEQRGAMAERAASWLGGPNFWRLNKAYRAFDALILRAPSQAILAFSTYGPFNALEEFVRGSTVGSVAARWLPNEMHIPRIWSGLTVKDPSLAQLTVGKTGVFTEIQNQAMGSNWLMPYPISKLNTFSIDLVIPMRRGFLVNKWFTEFSRIFDDPALKPFYVAARDVPEILGNKEFRKELFETALGVSYFKTPEAMNVLKSVFTKDIEKAFSADKLLAKYGEAVSPAALASFKDDLYKMAETRDFSKMGGAYDNFVEKVRSDFERRPEYVATALPKILSDIGSYPINTVEDAARVLESLKALDGEIRIAFRSSSQATGDRATQAVREEHWHLVEAINKEREDAQKLLRDAIENEVPKLRAILENKLAKLSPTPDIPNWQAHVSPTITSLLDSFEYARAVAGNVAEVRAARFVDKPPVWADPAERAAWWTETYEQVDAAWSALAGRKELEEAAATSMRDFYREASYSLPQDVGSRMRANLDALYKQRLGEAAETAWQIQRKKLDLLRGGLDKQMDLLDAEWGGVKGQALEAYFERIRKAHTALPEGAQGWLHIASQDALDSAADWVKRTFTDYDGATMLDDYGRSFIPFWMYSTRAFEWTLRNGFSHPAIAVNFYPWGKYWTETDRGYIPMPLLDYQASPARSTGMVGKLRRLMEPDYPERHRGLAGAWEKATEIAGSYGLFFAPAISFAGGSISTLEDIASGRPMIPEISESLPPYITSALNIIYWGKNVPAPSALPDDIEQALNNIRDIGILDFVEGVHKIAARSPYSEMFARRYAYDTFHKPWDELKPEQQKAAYAGGAFASILMEQTSVLRYKPDELIKTRNKIDKKISEITGRTSMELEEAARRGIPSWQIAPLNRAQLKEVQAIEGWKALLQITLPLRDSERQAVDRGMAAYYRQLDALRAERFKEQKEDDARIEAKTMLPSIWRKRYQGRWNMKEIRKLLEDAYEDAAGSLPITYEEKRLWHEMRGLPYAPQQMLDALLDNYFSMEAHENPLTGVVDVGGYMKAREQLIASLPKDTKAEFEEALKTEWETPLVGKYRAGNKTLLRDYWDWEEAIIREYRNLGDNQSADLFQGVISRANEVKEMVQKLRLENPTLLPEELSEITRPMLRDYDLRLYNRIEKSYKQMFRQTHPEANTFLNTFFAYEPT